MWAGGRNVIILSPVQKKARRVENRREDATERLSAYIRGCSPVPVVTSLCVCTTVWSACDVESLELGPPQRPRVGLVRRKLHANEACKML